MRCNSSYCSRCNPPHQEVKNVLSDLLDCIDREKKESDDVLGWNTDEYWEFHNKPWFQAILMAYNAGVAAARSTVESELRYFEGLK